MQIGVDIEDSNRFELRSQALLNKIFTCKILHAAVLIKRRRVCFSPNYHHKLYTFSQIGCIL